MTNRFMISVAAAALIAGTGFANAQGTGTSREAPSAGSTVQQSAPSSDRGAPSAATMKRDSDAEHKGADKGSDKGMKATQSDEKMQPGAAKNQRAQDDMKPGAKGDKSAHDNDMKAEGRDGRTNAETKGGVDSKSQTTTQSQTNQSQTTGQAGAGAKLSTEQRTKITTVIKEQHVQPVTNV